MTNALCRWVFVLLMMFIATACTSSRAGPMKAEEREALSIAEKFVADRYADFDKRNKTPVLKDQGDHWEFTYELPEYMIGGAPVVVIDKRTMQVIRSFRTQ